MRGIFPHFGQSSLSSIFNPNLLLLVVVVTSVAVPYIIRWICEVVYLGSALVAQLPFHWKDGCADCCTNRTGDDNTYEAPIDMAWVPEGLYIIVADRRFSFLGLHLVAKEA